MAGRGFDIRLTTIPPAADLRRCRICDGTLDVPEDFRLLECPLCACTLPLKSDEQRGKQRRPERWILNAVWCVLGSLLFVFLWNSAWDHGRNLVPWLLAPGLVMGGWRALILGGLSWLIGSRLVRRERANQDQDAALQSADRNAAPRPSMARADQVWVVESQALGWKSMNGMRSSTPRVTLPSMLRAAGTMMVPHSMAYIKGGAALEAGESIPGFAVCILLGVPLIGVVQLLRVEHARRRYDAARQRYLQGREG